MSVEPAESEKGPSPISRRRVLGMLGALPAAAVLASRPRALGALIGEDKGVRRTSKAASGTLNVYTWPDYFAPDVLADFKKKTGITVNISTYDSNSVLFTELDSPAGAGYDIVIPSSSWVQQLASKALLKKLDHSKLKLSAIDSSLLGRNYDKDNTYTIPKDWGVLGVVYNPKALGGAIETWEDFYTYGAKPGVSGKVRMSDSAYETIGTQLWIKGINWNTTNVNAITAAADRVKAFAPHVATFESFQPSSMANGSIVLAQTDQSGARSALLQQPSLRWVVPGPTSELWVDNYAISAKAPHVSEAYEFLNFTLQPDIQIAQTDYIGYPAALNNLAKKLPSNVPDRSLIFGGSGLDLSKLTSYIVNPSTASLWEQLQDEIQAAAGS